MRHHSSLLVVLPGIEKEEHVILDYAGKVVLQIYRVTLRARAGSIIQGEFLLLEKV